MKVVKKMGDDTSTKISIKFMRVVNEDWDGWETIYKPELQKEKE